MLKSSYNIGNFIVFVKYLFMKYLKVIEPFHGSFSSGTALSFQHTGIDVPYGYVFDNTGYYSLISTTISDCAVGFVSFFNLRD